MNTIVFVDGQNLYRLAKNLWAPPGSSHYTYPCYDVEKVAQALVANDSERILTQLRFYTGVPHASVDPFWHGFWTNKLRYLSSCGVVVYTGRINQSGQEKGVDVSLAIDLVRRADAVIVTKSGLGGPDRATAELEALLGPDVPVFRFGYRPCRLSRLDGGAELPLDALNGLTVSLLCAIAHAFLAHHKPPC